jgi:hypothetical protein
MTIEETIARLEKLNELIIQNIPDMTQLAAVQSKSLIQERIQEFGLNAEEAELGSYSESYKKIRNKKGLQTKHVDLTNSGQMWRATRVVKSEQVGKRYEVSVAGGDSTAQNKLNYNSERYGDVLRTSNEEELKMSQVIDDRLSELIKEVGL